MTSSKVKLFYIAQILKSTDEHYPLTAGQIRDRLKSDYDIDAERKSICRDINILRDECGYDIVLCSDNKDGYFLASRRFEDWELKILIDLILGTKFLAKQDALHLMEKVKKLGSRYTQDFLKAVTPLRFVPRYGDHHVKYFIDTILQAISLNRKIAFQYLFRASTGETFPRGDGAIYKVNPYALIERDGFYYLICNYDSAENLSFYRIDRMKDVEITKETRKAIEELLGSQAVTKLSNFVNHAQYNYGGNEILLRLEVPAYLCEEISDRFGQDVPFFPLDNTNNHFEARIPVQDSPGLYFWLLQHADNIKVLAPENVRNQLVQRIKNMLALYE